MNSKDGRKWPYLFILMQSAILLCWYLLFDTKNKYILIAIVLTLATIGFAVSLQILRSLTRLKPPLQHQAEEISEEVRKERTRIASELHDTLGLQLLQALTLLEAQPPFSAHPARDLLEQSLVDLRLIVDSIDSEDDNLATQMARLRHRLTPALTRKGLQLHWFVCNPELEVGPHTNLFLPRGQIAHQILKVFQGSISNIVEHSQASEIWVTLQPDKCENSSSPDWDWSLCIEDNGSGFNLQQVLTDASQAGHGIKNMFHRMANIGANLQIKARQAGGTQVLIRWRQHELKESLQP
ncbi:MAG: ATP-binding protein [Comamonas sp.]|jgi:signal transduction histidine kinase|uniref:sensor histidine kinase n=1 Tax=Comamonas sp. TaxID=34028 RepID=UPI00282AA3BF|nr:ATP-binding protein [Comamonas sp.]MDR0215022.1 ATP-binding protein [Comamonas sp.]